MKIGIIGPNKLYNSDLDRRKQLLNDLAKTIADSGHQIVLTPDKDSLLEYFGQKYLECGGKKIWLIIPADEIGHEDYLNTSLGEVISCGDWDRQANEFNRQSDIFLCVGYSWGALKEIACAQYFNKKKTLLLKETISEKLPEELNFLVDYIQLDDVKKIINSEKL
ncbi:MAG: hypothetical protein M0R39_17525 [Prolixibacteraceae bacterium]|nr:hypothetical protein [Prolixibacteraceae bacterium]